MFYIRMLLILAALALVASGCATSNEETSDAATGGDQSSKSEQAVEITTLTFWIHGAEPFIAAHEEIVARFEEENPDIQVDLQSFPFNDFNTRVTASLPAGEGPDVLEAYSPWMVGYIRTGLMSQVPEDILGSTEEIQERYYESTLSLLDFQDQYYGVPANIAAGSTRVLLVNDDIVDEAGINIDDNDAFEDWISDWQALTAADGDTITRSGLGQSCGQPADQFVSYLLEYGGTVVSENGREAAFNSEAGRQALEVLGDLVNEYKVDSTSIADFTCIPQGTAATGYRGTWVIPEYERDFPDFNWHYELMPLPPGATEDLWQGGSGWATYVPESDNTDAAWRFVEYLEENRRSWTDNTGEIPAQRELAAQVAEEKPDLYGVYYPILEQSVHGYPSGDYFAIYQTLSDMVTSVTLGEAGVDNALSTAEDAINSHLEQWWSQYPEE